MTSVGNSNPEVVSRVQDQVALFTHTCFMVTPYEGYVEVCESLNRLTPGDHAKRSALFNSGAEAVENAVKIARAYTKRQAVVVVEHAYHGRTNLTMAMTAKDMPYKHGFGPFASDIYRVPTSYPFRDDLDGAQAAAVAITKIEKEVGSDQVAALVIEPIQGEGGFVVPAPGFLKALSDFCTDNGIVFIADEIQTGFARTGGNWSRRDHGCSSCGWTGRNLWRQSRCMCRCDRIHRRYGSPRPTFESPSYRGINESSTGHHARQGARDR